MMMQHDFVAIVGHALATVTPDSGFDEDGDFVRSPDASELSEALLTEIDRAGYKLVKQ